MATPIDGLLRDLQEREARCRTIAESCRRGGEGVGTYVSEADHIARQIAAVEELVKNQATTVRLAPRVGLQPMAILDESDPEGI